MAVRKALLKEFSTTPPFGLPIGLTMVSTTMINRQIKRIGVMNFPILSMTLDLLLASKKEMPKKTSRNAHFTAVD